MVFGITDSLELVGVGEERMKQADIIDTLSNLSFVGDEAPSVSLESVIYEGKELDVLRIYNTDRTPIFLKKDYGNMKAGCIYARVGDKNTPNNGNASITDIENLWRKRFGLTKPPLDYMFDRLSNKLEWVEDETGFYNMYKPEYVIEHHYEEEIGYRGEEFYSYAQTNEATYYYEMFFKANGTVLKRFQVVSLDSGRLCMPVPDRGYIHIEPSDNDTIDYCYYVDDSYSERFFRFLYNPYNMEQRHAFSNMERIMLFFESEEDRKDFERYVICNKVMFENEVAKVSDFEYIITESEKKTNNYKRRLRNGIALKNLYEQYKTS